MVRLLEEASKISGIKYDISSYADVTQAIHIMQQEMGIAGTTAKEAEKTVEGSANSMKSAWDNLLVGISSGDKDLKKLTDDLMKSVETFIGNIVPIIGNVVNSLVEMFPFLKPIKDALQAIMDNMSTILPILIQVTAAWVAYKLAISISSIIQAVTTAMNGMTIAQYALNLAMSLNPIGLIVAAIAALVAGFIYLWNTNEGFRNFWIGLWDSIVSVFNAAISGIVNFFTVTIPNILNSVISFIAKNWQSILTFLINPFAGIISFLYNLNPKFKEWVDGIIKSIGGWFSGAFDIGANLVKGIWNGIQDAGAWLLQKIKDFGGAIVDGFLTFFGIHSPSKLMRDMVGGPIAAGIVVGFEKDNPMKDIRNSLENGLGAIKTSMNLDMAANAQLTAQNSGAVNAPTLNFYDTQTTPDAIYRRFNQTMTYGLAGGV